MTDPKHLHDLNDGEHRALELLDEKHPLASVIPGRLLDRWLAYRVHEGYLITPDGQAIRDRVRELAAGIDEVIGGTIYLKDCTTIEAGGALGRAVLRQWEADHAE